MKRWTLPAAMGALLLLQACGGEPSEADMRAALERRIAAQKSNPIGSLVAVDFDGFQKSGCQPVAGSPDYSCEYKYKVRRGGSIAGALEGGTWQVGHARFGKTPDGWAVVGN